MSLDIDRIGAYIESECQLALAKPPVFYQWPSMSKVVINQLGNLNSGSVYMFLAPNVNLDSDSYNILFIWLGREVLHENNESQLISDDSGRLHWEMIGHIFINHMGIPRDTQIQVRKQLY